MYTNILIATDGSDRAGNAARHEVSLAKSTGTKITALNVSQPYHWFAPNMVPDAQAAYAQEQNQAATVALSVIADLAKSVGVAVETMHVEGEHPSGVIIDTAKAKNCDLIVMGSHGRRGISAVILDSETAKVLTHSTIPVLVCR